MSIRRRRILLVNPAIEECKVPHYGLASLAATLTLAGHDVRVADYHYSHQTPPLQVIMQDFQPDAVGISIFSVTKGEADKNIDILRSQSQDIPIICGGPHVSCYWEDMIPDPRIDYLVIGEAEDCITALMENARRVSAVQTVHAQYPAIEKLPFPDYTRFYRYEDIKIYPMITSRGCPYGCIFCAVKITNSRAWRPKPVEHCMEELVRAKRSLPHLREAVIWDDLFNLQIKRGKEIIRALIEAQLGLPLRTANFRADKVDDELIELLRDAGCESVQLGIEHGDPRIFQHLNKGESLEDIRRASYLAKKHRMKLYLSFIIGFPGDSIKKTLVSIHLARELQADKCHWNILVPYRGTRVYDWFREHGKINETWIPHTLGTPNNPIKPNAETSDFPAQERIKAHAIAQLMTENWSLKGKHIPFLLMAAIKYHFLKDFFSLIKKKLVRRVFLSATTEANAHCLIEL